MGQRKIHPSGPFDGFDLEINKQLRSNTNIRTDINKYYYESNGTMKFGGNYYIGDDVNDYSKKLNGTTSIINLLYPFADMINPVVHPWLAKLDRRDSTSDDPMGMFGEETKWAKASRELNSVGHIVEDASRETIEDGNCGEVVALHLLQNNGSMEGIEETIKREQEAENTILYKTERAVKFGQLAYDEIMKLGDNVILKDYQTVASDQDLWDIGFFDFVVEADGELILIDMKTGSWSNSKLEKVRFQLLGSYKKKFTGIFGKEPDRVVVIAAIQDEVKVGQIKKFKTFGKTIDITNDDPNGEYKEIYETTAKLYKRLFDSKIWSRNKSENKVSI